MIKSKTTTETGSIDFNQYLTSNAETGEIRTTQNKRAAIVTDDFLTSINDTIRERVGDDIKELYYNAGKNWSKREFQNFKDQFAQTEPYLYSLRNMNLNSFKVRFNENLLRSGWGTFDIYEKYDLIFINLVKPAYVEMFGKRSDCSTLFAGYFAAFFTELIGVEFDCVELPPDTDEQDKSVYLLGDESIVNSVKNWIDKGKSYDEILNSLENREYEKHT